MLKITYLSNGSVDFGEIGKGEKEFGMVEWGDFLVIRVSGDPGIRDGKRGENNNSHVVAEYL